MSNLSHTSPKVLIALSGGIDSAMSAYFLREQGYDVRAITLKLHDGADLSHCGPSEIAYAESTAAALGIPFEVLDEREYFKSQVVRLFADGYARGETPNPCVDCNKLVKFGILYRALGEGEHLATGHYVRLETDPESGRIRMKKALDPRKDQSYVLYHLSQAQLKRSIFPCGTRNKDEIRALATKLDLPNRLKPESQDICFIPDGDYAAYLRRYNGRDEEPGNFVSTDGQILGRHKGFMAYTIGQRKGLGIAAAEPLFVIGKNKERNEIILSPERGLYRNGLTADRVNWIYFENVPERFPCSCRTRYSQKEFACTVEVSEAGKAVVRFAEPQKAITPGQAVVFYDRDYVLGGGTITGGLD